MDAVYVCREGENPELRFSMRTLQNVALDNVWIFGGAPRWINPDFVTHVQRRQNNTPAASTRGHIKAACLNDDVSDPFMLWNDDFYAMRLVGEIPMYHRGPLAQQISKLSHYSSPWVKGMRATLAALKDEGFEDPLSYSVHLPLIVYKEIMLEAIFRADEANVRHFHLRTFYGNLLNPECPIYHEDPKVLRRNDPFPEGAWLSSSPNSFRSHCEPVLRYLFPYASPYEKEK